MWLHREREIACHGVNLFYEARNQSRAGQIGVLDVVSNRVNSDLFPNTFCDAIKQYRAFSWYFYLKDEVPKNVLHWERFVREEFSNNTVELKTLDLSMALARRHYTTDPKDTTGGAIYFMTLPAIFRLLPDIKYCILTVVEEDHLFFSKIIWR